jgi:nicotinamidase/pyrazinamidase
MAKSALVVVDVQNDFLPKGALGVKDGDQIIPFINKLVKVKFELCLASQDFHPPHHCSFASTWEKNPGEVIMIDGKAQTLWPDHCVQGTNGVAFSPELDTSHFVQVAHKGVDPKVESYSIFFDNQRHRSTGIEEILRKHEITDIYFAGLATDYCVLYSVEDAVELGYKPHVILDACRGIDLRPGDVEKAISNMLQCGAEMCTTEQVIQRFT